MPSWKSQKQEKLCSISINWVASILFHYFCQGAEKAGIFTEDAAAEEEKAAQNPTQLLYKYNTKQTWLQALSGS